MKHDTFISVIFILLIIASGYTLFVLLAPEAGNIVSNLPEILEKSVQELPDIVVEPDDETTTTTMIYLDEASTTTLIANEIIEDNQTIIEEIVNETEIDDDEDIEDDIIENETTYHDYTIIACFNQTIVFKTDMSDCMTGYICDTSKIGKTYLDMEMMKYDACIGYIYEEYNPEVLEKCELKDDVKLRELCIINAAISNKNVGICSAITQPKYTDMCLAQVAVAAVDEGLCYKVVDKVLMKECLKAVRIIFYSSKKK